MRLAIIIPALLLLTASCKHAGDAFKSYGEEISETRYVGSFDRIYAGEKFDIVLIQDSARAGTVVMTAGENVISGYSSKVVNGELRLVNENKFNWVRKLKVRQSVRVYFSTLNELQISGSARFTSEGIIVNTGTLSIKNGGLEDAVLNVRGDYIYADCTNTGGVELSGSCFLFSASVDDISFVKAPDLDAEKCYISSFSKAASIVNGIKELEVKLYGTGDIYYKSVPSSVFRVELNGSGKIYKY